MKVKLSPFTILFLLLNSILIFCASRKIDVEKKPASSLTHTNQDNQLSLSDTINAPANGIWITGTEIPAQKDSYIIGYTIREKAYKGIKPIIKASVNDDFSGGP